MITKEQFIESLLPIEKDLVQFYAHTLSHIHPLDAVLEVGSGWGLFTRSVMEFTLAKVTTLDKTAGYGLPQFEKNCDGFQDRIERIVEDSHTLLPGKELEWASRFDFIFIDGDHTQDGAAKDMRDAWPLLKSKGMMMVDDVFHKCNWDPDPNSPSGFNFGVARALWGFLQARKDDVSDIAIHPYAHGVVTIRKNHD